jgi:hypothetical protein
MDSLMKGLYSWRKSKRRKAARVQLYQKVMLQPAECEKNVAVVAGKRKNKGKTASAKLTGRLFFVNYVERGKLSRGICSAFLMEDS